MCGNVSVTDPFAGAVYEAVNELTMENGKNIWDDFPSWTGGVAAAKPQTGWLFKILLVILRSV